MSLEQSVKRLEEQTKQLRKRGIKPAFPIEMIVKLIEDKHKAP